MGNSVVRWTLRKIQHRGRLICHHQGVTDFAELNSLASSLSELTERITQIGENAHRHGDDELAGELFAVERALSGAHRRLLRASGRGE
jgi:hypothetical protein